MEFMLRQSARNGQGARDVPERIPHYSIKDSCHRLAEFLPARKL
jgi:hypothetical protein